jgi:Zn-dependent peptidase ImmA (M78 family)
MNLNKQAEIKARIVFRKYHLRCPVNLYYLSNKVNAEIREIYMPGRFSGFVRKMGMTWWADNKFIIVLNRKQLFLRKRFTIAHEIGHIVLNHRTYAFSSHDIIEYKDKELAWAERQADVFATELLMPKDIFRNAYFNRGIKDVNELMKLFGVSKRAVEIRIEQITRLSVSDQLPPF